MNITAYPKYDSYKESGIDWIGSIPTSWETLPLRHLSRIHSGNGFPHELQGDESGTIPFLKVSDFQKGDRFVSTANNMVNNQTIRNRSWNIVPRGSLVTAKIGEALRRNHRNITQVDCIIDNNCIAFEPCKTEEGFFYYLHKVIDFDWFVNPGAVPSISVQKYRSQKVALPSLPEQHAIAAFLDRQCAAIDEAARIKEEQIKLLRERRQILIQQAVTRGLNPDAPMKDSGIDWIGQIPVHWEVRKVKQLFRLVADAAEKNNSHELLSIYTDIGVRPRKDLEERGNKASTTDGYWLVKKGDFIVNKLLAWMGAIGLSEYEGVTSPAYDILRARVPMSGRYYHRLFRSKSFSLEIKRFSRGIMEMRLRIYFDKLGVVAVPCPPMNEQREIVNYLGEHEWKIDKAIALKEHQIAALKEYKTSLINAAVTGKIKVTRG